MNFTSARIATVAFAISFSSQFIVSVSAQAENFKLTELFMNSFYSDLYQPRKCGKNILSFVDLAAQNAVHVKGATIVKIENGGFSNLGMTKGWMAREGGSRIRTESPDSAGGRLKFHPGSANWYFHVFLVESGFVYDFDFGNAPRVLPLQQYVQQMFATPPNATEIAARVEDYRVELISAEAQLERQSSSNPAEPTVVKMKLTEYLAHALRSY